MLLGMESLLELPVVQIGLKVCAGIVLVIVVGLLPLMARANRRQIGAEVNQPGLYGVVGRFGSGKSVLLAWFVVTFGAGRQVLANCDVRDAVRYSSWLELMWYCDDGALVLMDEVSLWWPPGNQTVPKLLEVWVRQLRKRRVTMLWATQGWSHAGRLLRDLTFACWVARNVAGHHVYSLHERSQMDRQNHGLHTTKVHVKRSRAVREAFNTHELVEEGGWLDVPDGVSVEDFLRASGREPVLDARGKAVGWTPRPLDGPDLSDWLRSLPTSSTDPERRAPKARTGTGRRLRSA